jgi:hypothetical protein
MMESYASYVVACSVIHGNVEHIKNLVKESKKEETS